MPSYFPLDVGVPLKASASDLVAFHWSTDGITADFLLPDRETHLLRVEFDMQCVVRLLDEMPLSTEVDTGPSVGLVSDNFAYRLEGAVFPAQQSETWREVAGPVTHYRFVTGWACMDVLCKAPPSFTLVERK